MKEVERDNYEMNREMERCEKKKSKRKERKRGRINEAGEKEGMERVRGKEEERKMMKGERRKEWDLAEEKWKMDRKRECADE